jgi:hypothetical protein
MIYGEPQLRSMIKRGLQGNGFTAHGMASLRERHVALLEVQCTPGSAEILRDLTLDLLVSDTKFSILNI